MDISGIGALNVDKIYRVPRIGKEGEEIPVLDVYEAPGGSAANTVVALARLGLETGFIGVVGKDREGRLILEEMERSGVSTECIEEVEEPTGTVIALVDREGERTMYAYPGANNMLEINESNLECVRKSAYLHLSSFVMDESFLAQSKILQSTEAQRISFSPGMLYARHRCLLELKELIARSDVIFLNREEAFHLTGNRYKRGAEELVRLGAGMVAVTLGEEGCYIKTAGEVLRVEGEKAEPVDTTGAGDAFAAGFLYGLIKGYEYKVCGRIGNFMAARCIERLGARAGLPHRNGLEDFLAEL